MKACGLLAVLFSGWLAGADQDKADSSLLQILTEHHKRDSVLNQLAYEYYLSDPAKAILFAGKSGRLPDSLGYAIDVAGAYRQMGLRNSEVCQSDLIGTIQNFYMKKIYTEASSSSGRYTFYILLHGIIHHDVYRAARMLIKKHFGF